MEPIQSTTSLTNTSSTGHLPRWRLESDAADAAVSCPRRVSRAAAAGLTGPVLTSSASLPSGCGAPGSWRRPLVLRLGIISAARSASPRSLPGCRPLTSRRKAPPVTSSRRPSGNPAPVRSPPPEVVKKPQQVYSKQEETNSASVLVHPHTSPVYCLFLDTAPQQYKYTKSKFIAILKCLACNNNTWSSSITQ